MNIYQEHILEHYKNPVHYGKLENATHEAHDHNPLCGDEITVRVRVDKGKIMAVAFESKGCAIAKASASILMEYIAGKDVALAKKLSREDMLSMLSIPLSVSRVKCGMLGLITLKKALYEVKHASA